MVAKSVHERCMHVLQLNPESEKIVVKTKKGWEGGQPEGWFHATLNTLSDHRNHSTSDLNTASFSQSSRAPNGGHQQYSTGAENARQRM